MHEKSKLIESMTNLINHITKSKANQQEIFATFSQPDLFKIISNLEDSSQLIRKNTLSLLAFLLYGNTKLQQQFCQKMEIPYIPGKLVLNLKMHLGMPQYKNRQQMMKILNKIKEDVQEVNQQAIIWYIDQQKEDPRVVYIKSSQTRIDPKNYIAGLVIKNPVRTQKPKIPFKDPKHFSPRKHIVPGARELSPKYIQKRTSQNKYLPFHKINKTIAVQPSTERNGDRKHSDSFSSSHYTSNESNRQLTTSFQDIPSEKMLSQQQHHYMHKVVSTNPTNQKIRIIQNPNNSFELLKPPPPVPINYIKQQFVNIPNSSRQSYPVAGPYGNLSNSFGHQRGPQLYGTVKFQHK